VGPAFNRRLSLFRRPVHGHALGHAQSDLADRARWQDLGDDDLPPEMDGGESICHVCGESWNGFAVREEADERYLRLDPSRAQGRVEAGDRESDKYLAILAMVEADLRSRGCAALELAFGCSDWCKLTAACGLAVEHGGRRRLRAASAPSALEPRDQRAAGRYGHWQSGSAARGPLRKLIAILASLR
jgi:hypothetical protein